jgi:transposase-like protein
VSKEFPRTLLEFEQWFRTEEACRDYLVKVRWPEGFVCTRCKGRKAWRTQKGLFHCPGCNANVSVTAGSVFHRSKIPLRLWFRAMWWMTNQKTGVNAMGLKNLLGLPSYQTAWTMLHKLRRAMVRPGRGKLEGEVEVDETLLGGLRRGNPSRLAKNIVIIAAEIQGKETGRIRAARIPHARGSSIVDFVEKNVAKGATVISDGAWAYRWLEEMGYGYRRLPLLGKDRDAGAKLLPRVHRIAALLKRWVLGTYQGRVSAHQLDHYLAEFIFRFNRRKSATRGQLFYRLVQQCVGNPPSPYRGMIRA